MDPLTLPLDQDAIERILPHRFPFLFVDRIVELEPDRRIVGVKKVSHGDRYLTPLPDGRLALSRAVLTETVAQVGAIMVLARPENRDKLVFFMGIERVRYRRSVCRADRGRGPALPGPLGPVRRHRARGRPGGGPRRHDVRDGRRPGSPRLISGCHFE
jgi:3-hydroxyacyl-[acyl-carrier-protein] dehydratase